MSPPKPGYFVLRDAVKPALQAGSYVFQASQALKRGTSEDLTSGDPLPQSSTHLEVTAPRFVLPPDHVLSTFPPNQAAGAWSSRLPQIVLRRRTLPWERSAAVLASNGSISVPSPHSDTPWLALVVLTESEGELLSNQPVAKCVSEGVSLSGRSDAEYGSCIAVRRSVVHRVFPARDELHLLAHVREVDLSDTELAMGDDDGWMAVLVANRLPQPGTRYRVCLVSLEGQIDKLAKSEDIEVEPASSPIPPIVLDELRIAPRFMAKSSSVTSKAIVDAWSATPRVDHRSSVPQARAQAFEIPARWLPLDPIYRFPVLTSWTFACTDDGDFQSRMQGLDVGLVGTVPAPEGPPPPGERPTPPRGRPAPQVLATGHVALEARDRDGETETLWYRGPLLARPGQRTQVDDNGVLPVRHTSDHGREIGVDGRERVGLAVAFEIGRLLALAEPSIVAALLRWRRRAFEVERRSAILELDPRFGSLLAVGIDHLGHLAARNLLQHFGNDPISTLGPIRGLIDPRVDPVFEQPSLALHEILRGMGLDAAGVDLPGATEEPAWTIEGLVDVAEAELGGLRAGRDLAETELLELSRTLADILEGGTP